MDAALAELDLLVAVDLVQRESHRHADWLIPGTHWLERAELNPLFAGLQEEPYTQYAQQAVDPPEGLVTEWEFFIELALAMKRNMFGKPGLNRFIRASRAVAKVTRRPKLAMNPEWIQRLLLLMGRRVKWKDVQANPHGWVYGEKRYGDLKKALMTPDKRVQLAPSEFLASCRDLLGTGQLTDERYPLILVNKRKRESMNSWLNESPGLYKLGRENPCEIHPDDAAAAGIGDGDLVRVSSTVGSVEIRARISDAMRPGVVCIPHGWGTRTFDPTGKAAPQSFGVNRNLLVDSARIDPLSQTPALNSTAVRVELVEPTGDGAELSRESEPVGSS
jgi:formate dehydrogenase